METKTLVLKPVKQYKIDPNKIQSLDDVISILKNVTIYVNGEEALEGLEHLIEKDNEQCN
ncbi:hypothetical protein FT641_21235 [Bacillus paranthracis]|uniref:hypothetical protein n=1 Tax=Bacillus TaxID=1386 RepID=UPI00019FF746|nr:MULTISPECIES: hypothetical protein [Bacillus]EEK41974.1 hypothetical protein bcere0001_51380 [Bacillus cereus m1293]EJR11152.1 hypothetical protein II9_04852 [Bacillus cereus MSX-D12]KMP64403.1 hypothetical protein TU61_23425 [Bacillus cereus]KMP65560.1 hypothetical protein TU61_19520 [Bacillus cereus]MBE7134786.1 hypothetical protein [Bacillus paranthracis]